MDEQEIDRMVEATAYDRKGDKIGEVTEIYVHEETEEPTFVSVRSGATDDSGRLVPVTGYSWDSDNLVLPYDRAVILEAPRLGSGESMSESDEKELVAYYESAHAQSATDDDKDAGDEEADAGGSADRSADVSEGTSVTLSEERLNVGTEQVETGRVRLRKYTTTEMETITVPVTKEKVVIERVPVDAEETSEAIDPDATEHLEEIVVREERPVVRKETVTREEVRLAKETVTEDVTVTEEVLKEQVEIDKDATGR